VEFAVLRQELDAQLRAHRLPRPFSEGGLVAGSRLGRADKITHAGISGAQLVRISSVGMPRSMIQIRSAAPKRRRMVARILRRVVLFGRVTGNLS